MEDVTAGAEHAAPAPDDEWWLQEPPGDYNPDDDPGYDDIVDRDDVPMLIIIGDTISSWNPATQQYDQMAYDVDENGRVVARADNC